MNTISVDSPALMKFFVSQLHDIYWSEKHFLKALPRLVKKSTTEQLSNAFENHIKEAEEHVNRLEMIFEMTGEKVKADKSKGMTGIIDEINNIISDTNKDTITRDAALILAAQKAEHYQIATYGGLATIARHLELPEVATILLQTLKEEKSIDINLTDIAENEINLAASGEEQL